MRIFISHSSKDKALATAFSGFLESVNSNFEVFCTSDQDAIGAGKDFVAEITKNMEHCDVFIPVLSKNYYRSRFCMVELGFAYSLLLKDKGEGGARVYPICVPPIKKNEALSGTPFRALLVGEINTPDHLREYLNSIFEENDYAPPGGLNRKVHAFVAKNKELLLDKDILTTKVRNLACKSDVPGKDEDYLKYSVDPDGSGITLNFRAKPFGGEEYPDFLSFVYQYIDPIDLYEPAIFFGKARLEAYINSYTNSIRSIDVEIKYSDLNKILKSYSFELHDGDNKIEIPLEEIRYEALRDVREICFVIRKDAYIEDEGMLQIRDFRLILEDDSQATETPAIDA